MLAVLLAGIALAGCAETKLVTQAAKSAAPEAPQLDGLPPKGVYKVGDPYQIEGVWYYPAEDLNYDEAGVASWYGPGFHAKLTANGEDYDQNAMTAAHRTLPMPSFVRVTNLDNGRSVVLRINDRGPYARGRIIDISRRGAQLLGFEQNGTAKVRVQILREESEQIADAMRSVNRVAGDRASKGTGTYIARAPASNSPPPSAAPRDSVAAETLAPPNGARAANGGANTQIASAVPVASSALRAAPIQAPKDPTGPAPDVAPRRTQIFVQVAALSNPDRARSLSNELRSFGPSGVVPVRVADKQLHRVRIGPLANVEDGDRTLDQIIRAGYADARIVVD